MVWNPSLAELIPEGPGTDLPLLPPSLVRHCFAGCDDSTSPPTSTFSAHDLQCIYAWGHRNGLEDGRNPEKLDAALSSMRAAKDLGCRIVRVVCGDQDPWSDDPDVRLRQVNQLRAPLETITREAERLDLVVAVENHVDRTIADVLGLVSPIGSENLGICLDVGNAMRVGDDPVSAVETALRWIVMTHLRDLRVIDASRGDPGAWWPCVALGEGDLDVPGILAALASAPRCGAWLVELSNLWPGSSELETVDASLGYLRSWLDPVIEGPAGPLSQLSSP